MDDRVEEFTARLLISVESSVHVTRWPLINALQDFWGELINRETIRSCNYFAPPIDYHAVRVVTPILLESGYWLVPVRLSLYYHSPTPDGFAGRLLREEQDSLGGAVLCDIRALDKASRSRMSSAIEVSVPRSVHCHDIHARCLPLARDTDSSSRCRYTEPYSSRKRDC